MSIFLSLYPKKFGYSLGDTPIGSAGRAPNRKKSIGERWEIEANGKEPTGRQVVEAKSATFHQQRTSATLSMK
jgi:hypothetical protein